MKMPIHSYVSTRLPFLLLMKGMFTKEIPGIEKEKFRLTEERKLHDELDAFFKLFEVSSDEIEIPANGLFGYINFDAVQHFENISFSSAPKNEGYHIPEVRYCFYKYVVAIDHHKNQIHMVENLLENETSQIDYIHHLLINLNFSTGSSSYWKAKHPTFQTRVYADGNQRQGTLLPRRCISDCAQPAVFAAFEGDDFNVYRALSSINPSPYLFYFDYGTYRIFGSSPEAELRVKNNRAYIHPIAGTFRRTGNDEQDRELAAQLSKDPKENAEHVMLVDLARNDLSRNASHVRWKPTAKCSFIPM
jgi:anthranilate synthase component I